MTPKAPRLVRYVPFQHGSPAWMPMERAQALLERDDRDYLDLIDHIRAGWYGEGTVSEVLARLGIWGPPHIEYGS